MSAQRPPANGTGGHPRRARPAPGAEVVRIQAPARLHLGLFDLRGDLGRRFGGAGMALESPSLLLEATSAPTLSAGGPEAERLLGFARRFLAHHGLSAGAHLELRRAIPAHAGLGSGTQLALATPTATPPPHFSCATPCPRAGAACWPSRASPAD